MTKGAPRGAPFGLGGMRDEAAIDDTLCNVCNHFKMEYLIVSSQSLQHRKLSLPRPRRCGSLFRSKEPFLGGARSDYRLRL